MSEIDWYGDAPASKEVLLPVRTSRAANELLLRFPIRVKLPPTYTTGLPGAGSIAETEPFGLGFHAVTRPVATLASAKPERVSLPILLKFPAR